MNLSRKSSELTLFCFSMHVVQAYTHKSSIHWFLVWLLWKKYYSSNQIVTKYGERKFIIWTLVSFKSLINISNCGHQTNQTYYITTKNIGHFTKIFSPNCFVGSFEICFFELLQFNLSSSISILLRVHPCTRFAC